MTGRCPLGCDIGFQGDRCDQSMNFVIKKKPNMKSFDLGLYVNRNKMVQIDFILHNALQNKNEAKCKTALHKIDILANKNFFLNFRHFLNLFFHC